MEFATSKDQYSGENRKLLRLEQCDGSAKFNTVEGQLIMYGVLDRKWSHAGEDTPGSVFYWFKHVVAPMYTVADLVSGETGHCGICFKDINYKYHYTRTGAERVNLNEKFDVSLPMDIVSGSECIKLTREMKNLLHNLKKNNMYCNRLRFTRGRILARDIVNGCGGWDVESIALPLRWFYFEDWWRPVLMLGQDNMGYGRHTSYRGSEHSVWGNMKRAANGERNISAFHLFDGEDESHEKVDIYTHGRQSAEDDKYVVLTRQSAMNLAHEIRTRRTRLKNKGIFRDDK